MHGKKTLPIQLSHKTTNQQSKKTAFRRSKYAWHQWRAWAPCLFPFVLSSFIQFTPSPYGIDNSVYLIHNTSPLGILKIYTKKNLPAVQSLHAAIKELQSKGIKTPLCYSVFEIRNYPAVLYEYCKGDHPFSPSFSEIHSIVKEMATLHQTSISSAITQQIPIERQTLLHLLNKCPTLPNRKFIEQLIYQIHFDYQASLPRGLVHGDFSPSNLLVDKDEVTAILDFDHLCITDLLSDLARSQIFFAFNGEEFCIDTCLEWKKTYNIYRTLTHEEQNNYFPHILIHLIKMHLETYYYVEELKDVSNEIFHGFRVHQSPQALQNKIFHFLKTIDEHKQ